MKHRCPRKGCREMVDNRLFACHNDWYALSRSARQGIYATASLGVLATPRREAFAVCYAEWEALAAEAPSA